METKAAPAETVAQREQIQTFLRKFGTVLGAAIIFIFFAVAVPSFFTTTNIMLLLRQMSMLTIVSLGFTFVMAAGGFDMSVGMSTGLVNMVLAGVILATGNAFLAVCAALATGLALGLVNGALVAYIGLPDFIGTFAIGSVAYGLKMLSTKGNPIFFNAPPAFNAIGQGYVGLVPVPVIIMFVVVAVAVFALNRTTLGRRISAIGGNPVACTYAGINVRRYRMLTFLISGLAVALASIILTSRLGSGQPLAGEDFLLDAISAVFLSTTMFGEGEPTAAGAFVGAFIISMLNNGLTMLNVPYYFQYITKGGVVILAVMLSVLMGQKLRVKF
jgi:ribose/xylose/arabinose/galactoside ABC-type transport system permease subunit